MEHPGPSTTARRVAAHRLTFPRLASADGRPQDDEALARDVAGDMPVEDTHMHRYLARRTAFFDAVVVTAIDGGTDQVVIFGAGYDARSLRYARDGVRFFEVDLPGTQGDKLERLERLGAATSSIAYLAADFATDAIDVVLTAAGLDEGRASLFVLEGVTTYLAADVLAGVLAAVRSVAGPRSWLAVSVGLERRDGDAAGAARAAAFRARVGAVGEPVLSTFGPSDGASLLARCGWDVTDEVGPLRLDPAVAARRNQLGFLMALPGDRG